VSVLSYIADSSLNFIVMAVPRKMPRKLGCATRVIMFTPIPPATHSTRTR
jgi:hypothetical protein